LRSQLYTRRKEHLLAKLKKEFEVLRNKARFIKAVIEEEIQIKRVKRQIIANTLKAQKYATMSELNEIHAERRRTTVVVNEDNQDEDQEGREEPEEAVPAGATPPKEYDYLLTMPLWALSEEKIEELTAQMNKKKDEHDQLSATHIHTLWGEDLDALLAALGKQEEEDERDRLAHKTLKNEGKKGGRRGVKGAAPAQNKKPAKLPAPGRKPQSPTSSDGAKKAAKKATNAAQ